MKFSPENRVEGDPLYITALSSAYNKNCTISLHCSYGYLVVSAAKIHNSSVSEVAPIIGLAFETTNSQGRTLTGVLLSNIKFSYSIRAMGSYFFHVVGINICNRNRF